MKIKEFQRDIVQEDQSFFDLSANLRRDPADDEPGKFSGSKTQRKPTVTLRHINKLKKMKAAQREEHEKRKKLLGIMYGIPEETEA